MKNFFKKINTIVERKEFIVISLFSFFVTILDVFGISMIMPFIAIVVDDNLNNMYIRMVYDFFGFTSLNQFKIYLGFAIIIFYIFKTVFIILLSYIISKYTHKQYYTLSFKMFKKILAMNYKLFVEKNSSDMIHSITADARNTSEIILSIISIFIEIITFIFIYSLMLLVNKNITIIITLILLISVFFIWIYLSRHLKDVGIKMQEVSSEFYKLIYSTFGNFKIVKLRNNDNLINSYSDVVNHNIKYNTIKTFSTLIPRFILELVGSIVLILIVLYFVWMENLSSGELMSTLALFVLSLLRLMPSVHKIVSSTNILRCNIKSLDIVYDLLQKSDYEYGIDKLNFNREIVLKDITFSYKDSNLILDKLNLIITKSDRVAFVGDSGGGKSTLVDILIGLLDPQSGEIFVDGELLNKNNVKNWREQIGYVPQNVYLFDGTVAENVSFGREYDESKIKLALSMANILDFLELEAKGINTLVGDGGIKISGGQKQRIGLARALYGNPKLLILDEATSALDAKIEKQIMSEIYNLSSDITIVIIAHRLNTLDGCNKIYKIAKKNLKQYNNLKELK